MDSITLFAVVLVVMLALRLIAGGMDGNQVKEYIGSQGGELLESRWSPFGRGWFGDKSDRIYDVRYRDRSGNLHEAACTRPRSRHRCSPASTSRKIGSFNQGIRVHQPCATWSWRTPACDSESLSWRKGFHAKLFHTDQADARS